MWNFYPNDWFLNKILLMTIQAVIMKQQRGVKYLSEVFLYLVNILIKFLAHTWISEIIRKLSI